LTDMGGGNFLMTSLSAKHERSVMNAWKVKRYRMNATTSRAEGLFESPRNPVNAWTALAATSENMMAVAWMD
jgi:hypothetical protein